MNVAISTTITNTNCVKDGPSEEVVAYVAVLGQVGEVRDLSEFLPVPGFWHPLRLAFAQEYIRSKNTVTGKAHIR